VAGEQLESISDSQQLLPVAAITLEAQALSDPEGRDHASFDLLASLPKWKESLRLRSRLGEETKTSHLLQGSLSAGHPMTLRVNFFGMPQCHRVSTTIRH
jgi:hypothetical protein